MKRVPLARRIHLRARSTLKPQPARRKAEWPLRRAVVKEALERAGYRCEFPMLHECAGPLDAHEVIPRSTWPAGHLVASNIRIVCRAAHEWISENPQQAHDIGMHGWSWERWK